ncbi:MAG: membrane integrity-associated transporter subunit PqiC [Burkholderiaceae bacterium]|nr:membrane integrity-associated transporter subunit PqiC [Burkholderiaceae bacterium]
MTRSLTRRRVVLGAGLVPALSATGLGGCVSLGLDGPTQAQLQYRWRDLGPPPIRRERPLVNALLLQAMPGAPAADTLNLVYTREGGALATYQFARWAERPLRVLPRALQQRLEARGSVGVTALLGDPQQADWLLTLTIDELHHASLPAPGRGRLAVTAELYDRRARQRVARRSFGAEPPLSGEATAAAAVQALSQALTQVLDAMLPWLEDALAAAGQR